MTSEQVRNLFKNPSEIDTFGLQCLKTYLNESFIGKIGEIVAALDVDEDFEVVTGKIDFINSEVKNISVFGEIINLTLEDENNDSLSFGFPLQYLDELEYFAISLVGTSYRKSVGEDIDNPNAEKELYDLITRKFPQK